MLLQPHGKQSDFLEHEVVDVAREYKDEARIMTLATCELIWVK